MAVQPTLLTTKEAADLLKVTSRTIVNWIDSDAIPYVELPSSGPARREFRIPLQGLLNSVGGNYDLGRELHDNLAIDAPISAGMPERAA
jgi:excisionase family DNA binding protein